MRIRLAENHEGKEVESLVRAGGFGIEGLDWSDIHPHWLAAEHEGEIVAVIMVSIGKPVGRLEMMATREDLDHRLRAVAVRDLLMQGLATLRQSGAQVAMGMVPFDLKAYKRMLKRRGAAVAFSGNTMVKRL